MEFETLEYIQEEKELVQEEIDFPRYGEKSTENAVGINSKEKYLFDINRGRVHLKKVTLQNRIQKTIILLRLDIGGPPHSNPPIDDEHARRYYTVRISMCTHQSSAIVWRIS